MKTAADPRHLQRVKTVKDLFSHSFHDQEAHTGQTREVLEHLETIDQQIAQAAPTWPLPKIAKIDLAILRLAVYELTITKEQPAKVIIDEVVELAKEYGGEGSAPFINGVLGTILHKTKGNV